MVFAGLLSPTSAQDRANLEGLVTNAETGMPLPGAHITIMGTPYGTAADETGRFYFYSLAPGRYDLEATHVGYAPLVVGGIVVTPEAPATLDLRLQPSVVLLPEVAVESEEQASAGVLSGGRVISREKLRKMNAGNVARALEMEGLASISSDGSPGGEQTVTLRGSGSNQVLVLVDGQPINEVADGSADLSRISLSEVEQIEVYPQAPPNLGAQTIGGAINIVTLKPGFRQFQLQAGFSEFGEKRGAVTLGHSLAGWPFLAVFEHRESTGQYRYRIVPDDGLNLFTRYLGQTFTRTSAEYRRDYLSLKLDPPGCLSLGYRRTLLHRQNPDYLPLSVLEHESTTEDDRQELNLSLEESKQWYRPQVVFKVEGYEQRMVTDYGPQFPLLFSQAELMGEAYGAELAWRRAFPRWEDVSFGTGVRFERLWSSELEGSYAERLHEFGYLQVQGNPLQAWNLPVRTGLFSGVRADLYRDEDAFVHPRLGVEIGGGRKNFWEVRAEMAGAYRLPSFNSLFWQEDLQSEGNPNLKPERSQNQEITGRIGCQWAEASLTYFDRQVWDLIYWRLDFDNRWKPLNISRCWIYGTEYNLRGHTSEGPFRSELSFSHRWMRAVNLSGEPNTHGNLLPYRPQNSTTLSLRQNLAYLTVDVIARWMGRRFTNEANTKSLAPYQVWDVGVSKQFDINGGKTSLQLRGQVRNLFDEDYRIVAYAPTSLREWWVSVGIEYR